MTFVDDKENKPMGPPSHCINFAGAANFTVNLNSPNCIVVPKLLTVELCSPFCITIFMNCADLCEATVV